ncbi:MAG: VCBS repeat-containing protein [Alphaproteobacteria bacterium]|nr:VCBS repeat-containing protein [Alphaproteobacteria bacterium]
MKKLIALLLALIAAPAAADIVSAKYGEPTTRYDHGILGDAIEYGALKLRLDNGDPILIRLPKSRVFEDLAPRLADVDGDGNFEVIVIETSVTLGAQLAIYDETGKIASTPFLGRNYRWLAPIGAVDLDGDGLIEIAYIEKPHLTKELKVWRFKDGALEFVAALGNLTNHSIGQDFISGGIRNCGDGPEIITADASWQKVMATRLQGGKLTTRSLGPLDDLARMKSALACKL